jgi:prepilin peptidase CpaA
MMPIMVFIFISIQLLVVAYIDFKSSKISNIWLMINFICFCMLTLLYPKIYFWDIRALLFPLAFIVVGFALYTMNIMGGGDSKFLSSLYLLVPLSFQDAVFLYLLYTTVIVGSSLLLFNILKNFDRIVLMAKVGDVVGIKKIFGKKFTFAPVIFIAWMWFGWQNHSVLGY